MTEPALIPIVAALIPALPDGLQSYVAPAIMLAIGLLLFALAPRILGPVEPAARRLIQTNILRLVISVFILLQVTDLILHKALADRYNGMLLKSAATLLVIYGGMILFNGASRLLDQRFGQTRTLDGKAVAVTSYHSRMASLIMVVALSILSMLTIIEIWGMKSLIQSTGLIGIVAAFFVLTNTVWFPDIYHGLALLGSAMAEEGDTIRIGNGPSIYIVNRLTPFYALLLNVDTNERVILRNSRLFDGSLENLTKRAAIEGLRRQIDLKLSYPAGEADVAVRKRLFSQVDKAVIAASDRMQNDPEMFTNAKVPLYWVLSESGDYALRFTVFFNIAPLPETKQTRKIRKYLRKAPASVTRLLYEEFTARGLHLVTPALIEISQTPPEPAD